ncbi:hypothetical protein ACEXQE_03540 [Herbiconiux sp. P17]|uniref:hypothetical protein n=1 Tax=Herbiconiux wuyangfengii TaxID=3342794 RepID=UPI0035B6F82A
MIDVVIGPHILPPIAWSALLTVTGITVAVLHRSAVARASDGSVVIRTPSGTALSLQVSFGSIAMAAAMPFMHAGSATAVGGVHSGHDAFGPLPLLALTTALYGGLSAHAIARTSTSPARIAEASAMTLSLGLMTSTSVLHLVS